MGTPPTVANTPNKAFAMLFIYASTCVRMAANESKASGEEPKTVPSSSSGMDQRQDNTSSTGSKYFSQRLDENVGAMAPLLGFQWLSSFERVRGPSKGSLNGTSQLDIEWKQPNACCSTT